MKKILISLSVMAAVAAVVVTATRAYFSDSGTLANNTFAAGSLDLQLGASNTLPFNVSNAVPGQSNTGVVTLTNATGSIDGVLNVSLADLVESENLPLTTPEIAAGDYDNGGDLGLFLKFAMFVDVNKNGEYDAGDIQLAYRQDGSTSGQVKSYSELNYLVFAGLRDSSMITSWNNIMTMTSGQSVNLVIKWQFPATNEYYNQNIAMTDSLGFNAVMSLAQVH